MAQENERVTLHSSAPELAYRDDPRDFAGKIAVFQYLTVLVFVFLVSGFWQLQVQDPEKYAKRPSETASRARHCWRRAGRFWIVMAA